MMINLSGEEVCALEHLLIKAQLPASRLSISRIHLRAAQRVLEKLHPAGTP